MSKQLISPSETEGFFILLGKIIEVPVFEYPPFFSNEEVSDTTKYYLTDKELRRLEKRRRELYLRSKPSMDNSW